MKSFRTFIMQDAMSIIIEEISKEQLKEIEKFADRLFAAVGVDIEFTKHFHDRVNDTRNNKPINQAELIRLWRQTYKQHGKKIPQLGKDAEAVIHDMKTNINIPFVLKWDEKSQELDLISKTVMRKKDFKSKDKELKV